MTKSLLSALLLLLTSLLSACSGTDAEEKKLVPVASYVATLQPHLSGKYNQEIAFYADLTRPSNKYRFFVLDLHGNKILEKGLCLNGRTDEDGNVIYSNELGSNCSSKGVAKVSFRYKGRFGKSYKLEGLETSNSNMFKRAVVLHAWAGVPNFPIPLKPIESEGCPTVSPDFLETLGTYIDRSDKPILLYIQ